MDNIIEIFDRALKFGDVATTNITLPESELLKYYEKVNVFNCCFKEEKQ